MKDYKITKKLALQNESPAWNRETWKWARFVLLLLHHYFTFHHPEFQMAVLRYSSKIKASSLSWFWRTLKFLSWLVVSLPATLSVVNRTTVFRDWLFPHEKSSQNYQVIHNFDHLISFVCVSDYFIAIGVIFSTLALNFIGEVPRVTKNKRSR
jgi:hypothetical protein